MLKEMSMREATNLFASAFFLLQTVDIDNLRENLPIRHMLEKNMQVVVDFSFSGTNQRI